MGLSMDSARKPLMKTGFQRIFLSESSHGSTVTNFCIQILKKCLHFGGICVILKKLWHDSCEA